MGAPEEMNTTTFFSVLPGPVTVSSVMRCLGFNLTQSGCLDMSMTCDFGMLPARVTFPEIVPPVRRPQNAEQRQDCQAPPRNLPPSYVTDLEARSSFHFDSTVAPSPQG